jgi:hypothetical protein
MKYQVLMATVIEARSPEEAFAHAVKLKEKLKELLENPLVRMGIDSEGIKIANGQLIVYKPQQIA